MDTPEPDLTKCHNCGGVADNGHDRCIPPNPYYCTKCASIENEMPDEIYVFPDPKSIGDMGFTVTNPDSTCSGVPYVQYHHSRIVEALQEENTRLREERKELAEVIVIHGGYPTDKQILMINSILEE